ncbi:MAG TPA: phage holin family protein [Gaiellaceae bacterium]|nr:phage holin family protein [Gaiellaceae bacterium]
MSVNAGEPRGIRASVRRVVRHASTIMALERQLAQLEMKRKAGSLGFGAGLGGAAAVIGFFAVGVGIATAVAALAIVLDLWLALLIVFAALLLLAALLAFLAVRMLRQGTPLAPEQALEEARLTRLTLKHRA